MANPNDSRGRSLTGVPIGAKPRSESSSSAAPRAADPNEALGRKLIFVAAARVVLVTLSLAALFAMTQLNPPAHAKEIADWQYVLIGGTYLISVAYAALLRFRSIVPVLGYSQIILDTAIVTVLVLMTGGVESVFAVTYVFVVVGAATTLLRRGAVIATIAVFLTYGTVVLLQVQRTLVHLPKVQFGTAIFAFIMHMSGFALVAILASALTERLRIADLEIAERESDLEQLEELHAAILRSLPAGLMTIDEALVIRYVNDAALSILRTSWDRLVGHRLDGAVPFMYRAWRERSQLFDHPLLPGRIRERFERSFVADDGTIVRIGFSFAPLNLVAGTWSGSIVVFQDVTDVVRLKEAVERAERLATVGKFAAGLAHEVRNPLASMCASIDVLEQSIEPPDHVKRLMSNVVKEADRLNELITHFLAFAKPRELEAKEADLSALVRSVLDLFQNEPREAKLTLHVELAPDLIAAIDEGQVRQVVWNLLRNSAEAMSSGGTLTVKTYKEADLAVLEIEDTGVGVPAEQVRTIFDPFFTTKKGGSGLGLAIAHAIVESHGGTMVFTSEVGVGTHVVVKLPTDLGSVDLVQTWDDTSTSSEFEIIQQAISDAP